MAHDDDISYYYLAMINVHHLSYLALAHGNEHWNDFSPSAVMSRRGYKQ